MCRTKANLKFCLRDAKWNEKNERRIVKNYEKFVWWKDVWKDIKNVDDFEKAFEKNWKF